MDAGIVGLPNVGKSTLFNALTKAGALAANYPFATIEPNVGVVPLPDPRLDLIASLVPTQRVVPATLRVVDIAGIVKGASQGEGLGNKFLSHIREVDAIVQVVRCFTKAPGGEEVIHVAGSVDPIRDIGVVATELVLADLETVDAALPKAERLAKRGEREPVARLEVLRRVRPLLESGRPARMLSVEDAEQRRQLRQLNLLTSKPMLYVMNVGEDDLHGRGEMCRAVRAHAAGEGSEAIPVCASIESELALLGEEDRKEMLAGLGLEEPALASLARAAYRLLGLRSFYTAGPKEVRAWTIVAGSTAPQAAGVIHSDFEKGFIRVEVYGVDDLARYKSEKAIKEAGRLRVEGREYVIRDGDVCHFLFNV